MRAIFINISRALLSLISRLRRIHWIPYLTFFLWVLGLLLASSVFVALARASLLAGFIHAHKNLSQPHLYNCATTRHVLFDIRYITISFSLYYYIDCGVIHNMRWIVSFMLVKLGTPSPYMVMKGHDDDVFIFAEWMDYIGADILMKNRIFRLKSIRHIYAMDIGAFAFAYHNIDDAQGYAYLIYSIFPRHAASHYSRPQSFASSRILKYNDMP